MRIGTRTPDSRWLGVVPRVALAVFTWVSTSFAQQVADTEFDVGRGLFDSDAPFNVTISSATPDVNVSFSVDGSDPSLASNSNVCTGVAPVVVEIDPAAASVACPDGTSVARLPTAGFTLRAYAHGPDLAPTNVDTQTYLFPSRVLDQPAELPGWPTYDYDDRGGPGHHDYEMDPDVVGDPAYAQDLLVGLREIPTMSLVANADLLYQTYRGGEQISVSVEILYPDGSGEQADAGAELHSHDRIKNSIRLELKTEFGDAKLDTELFRRARLHGEGAVTEVDRVVLRAGNNRSWARSFNPDRTTYTTDQWIRDTQLAMSGVGARGNFVHLYLNGIYFGLYNPTERPDEWFTSGNQGGEPEDWFAISHGGPKDGDPARYDYLFDTLIVSDLSSPESFAELSDYLDVSNFSDYLLLHWYAGITDWPTNNWWAGVRTQPPGPLQYFAWDGEWSFATEEQGSPERPEVHPDFAQGRGKGSGSASALLFNSIKENPEFLLAFADRAYRALFNDGALVDEVAIERFAALNTVVENAVVAESARWGDAVTRDGEPTRTRDVDWQNEVAFTSGYLSNAARDLVSSLRDHGYYPNVDPPRYLNNGSALAVTHVTANEELYEVSIERDGQSGSIYFTTDGSDPRALGGAPQGQGADGGTVVTLQTDTLLRARTLDGNEWSAVRELRVQFNCAEQTCDEGAPEGAPSQGGASGMGGTLGAGEPEASTGGRGGTGGAAPEESDESGGSGDAVGAAGSDGAAQAPAGGALLMMPAAPRPRAAASRPRAAAPLRGAAVE